MKTYPSLLEPQSAGPRRFTGRFAWLLLSLGALFLATGCHDPYYYGAPVVGTGYYAAYGSPTAYTYYGGYDPYYGGYFAPRYGVGTTIAVTSGYNRARYHRHGWHHAHRGDRRRDWRERVGNQRVSDRRADRGGRPAVRQTGRNVRRVSAPRPSARTLSDRQPE